MADLVRLSIFAVCFIISSVLCNGVVDVESIPSTQGQPWPLPKDYKASAIIALIDAGSFVFQADDNDCDILQAAFVRFKREMFGGFRNSHR